MSIPVRFLLAAVLAAFAGSSCFRLDTVRFDSQELLFRYDAEHDAVDVLLVYRGVQPTDDGAGSAAKAVQRVAAMVAKRRVLVIGDWPFEFDLDALCAERAGRPPSAQSLGEDAANAQIEEFLCAAEVRDAGWGIGQAGALELYQHVRMPKATLLADGINALLRAEVLQAAARSAAGDPEYFDAATWAKTVENARSGGKWLECSPRRIEVRGNLTERGFARMLAECVRGPENMGRAVVGALSELECADGVVRVAFLPDASGAWRFAFGAPGGVAHPELSKPLAERLAALGADFAAAVRVDEVRERFLH